MCYSYAAEAYNNCRDVAAVGGERAVKVKRTRGIPERDATLNYYISEEGTPASIKTGEPHYNVPGTSYHPV